ncbi:MAG: hypothetical protein WBM07_13850 [Chitinivibrionales bacterium]
MQFRRFSAPLCAVLSLAFGGNRSFAAESSAYISQTYIDTLIQRAYYTLNATEEISRAAPQKEDAIAEAKSIVKKLKKIAEGDKNKKYILWKVGELESQIYLEEKGLLLEKDRRRQMAVNELIGPFNGELAKPRPDFARLNDFYARMKDLDAAKAGDLEYSIRDRSKSLSREIVVVIEQCIEKGNFDGAREDLAYCKNNEGSLEISLTRYSTLTAKVQAHVSVDNEKAFIAANLTKADNACKRNDLGGARAIMKTIAVRLDGIKGVLYQREWDKLYFGNKRIARAIEHKEDSLVSRNLVLLKNQGVGAATEFSDSVLKKWDVAPEKIGKVNYAILEVAVAQKKKDTNGLSKDVEALVDNPQDSGSVMDDILAAAKIKAKAKADSARLAEEGNKRLTSVEKVRLDNMRLAEQGKEQREQQRIKENRDKAQHLLVEIYTLLEKGRRTNAKDEFKDKQGFFKEFLSPEAYKKLETAVGSGVTQGKN